MEIKMLTKKYHHFNLNNLRMSTTTQYYLYEDRLISVRDEIDDAFACVVSVVAGFPLSRFCASLLICTRDKANYHQTSKNK